MNRVAPLSWERLQLAVVEPTVLPIGGFHPIPIRSYDQDYDFRASLQRLHILSTLKRGGFQRTTREL